VRRSEDQPHDRIVLDDGTWVDVGADGRWRPSPGERARAAVILGLAITALVLVALVASVEGEDHDDDVASAASSTTTTEPRDATTTEAAPDPASIDGEAPSAQCVADDRDAQPLRERRQSVVLVLNASSRTGHAATISGRLEEAGYAVTVPGNAGRREVTSVAYLAGYCAEAERVVEDLGLAGATVEPVPPELLAEVGRARIVVSLGADSL
jgi:hypothetical protein